MLKRIFAVGAVIGTAVGLLSAVLTIVGFYFQFPDNKLPKWADVMSSAHPVAGALLTIASLLLSGVSIYLWTRRSKKKPNVREWYSTALERVVGKTFINQVVEVDGKLFEHCKFVNARLMFHGLGPCQFDECEVRGVLVETDNVVAIGMLRLHNMVPRDTAQKQLFVTDRHGALKATGPLLAPAPTDLPSQERPPSIPDPPLRIVAKIRNVDPFTDDRGGHKIEIEVDLFPARPIVQVAWFKLEWTDGMISGEGTGLDPIKTPGPLRLTSEESWPVTFHVAPPMRARGLGRIVAKANNEEVRSEWFEMNPTRR